MEVEELQPLELGNVKGASAGTVFLAWFHLFLCTCFLVLWIGVIVSVAVHTGAVTKITGAEDVLFVIIVIIATVSILFGLMSIGIGGILLIGMCKNNVCYLNFWIFFAKIRLVWCIVSVVEIPLAFVYGFGICAVRKRVNQLKINNRLMIQEENKLKVRGVKHSKSVSGHSKHSISTSSHHRQSHHHHHHGSSRISGHLLVDYLKARNNVRSQ